MYFQIASDKHFINLMKTIRCQCCKIKMHYHWQFEQLSSISDEYLHTLLTASKMHGLGFNWLLSMYRLTQSELLLLSILLNIVTVNSYAELF